MAEERARRAGLVMGVGGVMLGATITALLAAKPAEAAPPEEKLNYLIDVLTVLTPVLAEVAEGQAELITVMQQWLAAQGVAPPTEGVAVTVPAPWVAKEPEQIYSYAIRTIGTFYTDRMVDWTRGKRLLFKIESSLDVPCQAQVIGNFVDSIDLASDVNGIIDIGADENHTIGLAWDDWHPFVGIKITTAVAPAAGVLTIWVVIQE